MLENLNEFSRTVAMQIKELLPEWYDLVSLEEDHDDKYFLITVKPPSNSSDYPLIIDTSNNEVTVAFDHYHAHYEDFLSEHGNDAYSFIRHVLSEDSAIVSYWHDEEWCGSFIHSIHELPSSNDEFPYSNYIKIRSWSGAANKDITCISKG